MSEIESTAQTAESAASGGEYERQPVPDKARLGFKNFIGQYAGEHCAGTELMIGPLFVAAGVSAFDLIAGLIVGNLLAVFSWTFLTAPIATKARMTLYYHLEKLAGRNVVVLYNLANGVMFCFLAGAMVTVSATALGVMFKFPMPGFGDWMPNSVGWIISVLLLGGLISVVAACGYKTISKFANIAAPWMILVFLAFGLVALKQFIDISGAQVNGLGDLWTLADEVIWPGSEPLPGNPKFTFWHVAAFAWLCNMAMHVGMSDLSVFRFAKKSWYGVASASGMFVGHFMAWICAAMLFALALYKQGLTSDEAIRAAAEAGTLPSPAPGPLTFEACGIAGLLCVIIAGWTTANPTIYKAGLAFQAIMPKVSRVKVTLMTGLIATIAGLFPALAMKLLDFVALYGLILMPMGAVIFADWYLIPKLGLKRFYASYRGISAYFAPIIAWIATFVICVTVVKTTSIQIWFVALPGWFVAVGLYLVLSKIMQTSAPGNEMVLENDTQASSTTSPEMA